MKKKITYLIVLFLGSIFLFNNEVCAQIPTISIQTNSEILDEPKIPGFLTYTDDSGQIISSYIGIEIRGGFTQTFPKKTYDIEFWTDATGTESQDVQFGDLREDDDWIIDALYNEPLRINSYLSHKLWLDLNQLYYAEQEPKAKSGADVMYVEVTINNEYQGIYLLSEQLDRSLLKLKKNTNTDIRGELYKGYAWDDAVLFNDPSETPSNNSLTWSGYEYKYPTDIVDWSNAEELIDFVANSSDEVFIAELSMRFEFNNLMDYFIFLNLARLLDNRGKNIYLCRYDVDEPYFLSPWDLDGSWGLLWNGTNDTNTNDILSNNLFDRLIENDVDGFRQKISDKWTALRSNLISDESLENNINSAHQFLIDNDVFNKEGQIWDYAYDESNYDYMLNWLEDRLDFLDDYFDKITNVNPVEYSNISIYPNPAQGLLFVSGDLDVTGPLKVYNVLGVLVMDVDGVAINNSIDIDGLNPGVYYLEIGNYKSVFYKL